MPKHTSRTEKIYRHILILGTIAANPNLLAHLQAAIAQLGERQTEDLKVPGSIPGLGTIISTSRLSRPGLVSQNSATGTQTRVARVRAEYPNQLDYSGSCPQDLKY